MIDPYLLQYQSTNYPSSIQHQTEYFNQPPPQSLSGHPAPAYDYSQVCYYPQQFFHQISASPAPIEQSYLTNAAGYTPALFNNNQLVSGGPLSLTTSVTALQQGNAAVAAAVGGNSCGANLSSRSTPSSLKRRLSSVEPFTSNIGQLAPPASSAPPFYGKIEQSTSSRNREVQDTEDCTTFTSQSEQLLQQMRPMQFASDQQQQQPIMYATPSYPEIMAACQVPTGPGPPTTAQMQSIFPGTASPVAGVHSMNPGTAMLPLLSAENLAFWRSLSAGHQSQQQPTPPHPHKQQQQQQQQHFIQFPVLDIAAGSQHSDYSSPARTNYLSSSLSRRSNSGGQQNFYRSNNSTACNPLEGHEDDRSSEVGGVDLGGGIAYPTSTGGGGYMPEQLAHMLANMQLYRATTAAGVDQNQARTAYSPRLLHQCQESPLAPLWQNPGGMVYQHPPGVSGSPYPSQTNSPFSFYAMPSTHSVQTIPGVKPFGSAHANVEFDHDELAQICPGVNPPDLDTSLFWRARYFVIKSNSAMHVMQSIRHGVWCSTPAGNDCLNKAFLSTRSPTFPDTQTESGAGTFNTDEAVSNVVGNSSSTVGCVNTGGSNNSHGRVILFFSVNSSGCFCGVAEMVGPVNKTKLLNIWQDSRWRGAFNVRWIYAKNVPNRMLRHLQVESQENRAVTHLRDSNEILPATKGEEMLHIIHKFAPPQRCTPSRG